MIELEIIYNLVHAAARLFRTQTHWPTHVLFNLSHLSLSICIRRLQESLAHVDVVAEPKRAEIADIGIINHLLPAVRQDWSFGLRGLVSESRGHARWGFCSRPSASVYFWAAHLDGFRLLRDSSKANCPPKSMKVKFRWVHFLSVKRDNAKMLFRCIFRWCNFISIYK